ncbi:MAG: threonine ammonia-lyase [Atopobiaceae bacterium]|nr:threonine ammonia-lyase [Atopobiaceae bacterium]
MDEQFDALSLERFEEACDVVGNVTRETELMYSDYWSQLSGNRVWLKPENLQRTGAYKLRGAYYKISTMSEEERSRGLITASAGNHAQGVAYAAAQFGVQATIVMPQTTPLIKVNRTKDLGAEVVLCGNVYDESYEHALQLAEERSLCFVHPFNDLDVACGQGTIAMEIIKELPTVDDILVPVGGGGLACGVARLAKLLNPKIRVIGVEPAGAACLKASLEHGEPVTLDNINTIADGTAVKTPGDKLFAYLKGNLDDVLVVDDEELVVAFLDMVENHKMVVENSGLLSVAAVRQLEAANRKVVCVMSGGNMDVITMSFVVQQGLILRDRIFTISVLLPDRPGELVRVSTAIAEQDGNVVKLEHNQFVTINRNAAVELRITIEAFGTEHKGQIIEALERQGYSPRVVRTNI